MNIYLIAFILLLVLAILRFVKKHTEQKIVRIETFERNAEIFRQKASALSQDDETPVELLRFLRDMNTTIGVPDFGGRLARTMLRNRNLRKRGINPAKEKEEASDNIFKVLDRRPELLNAFADAMNSYLVATITISGGPWGALGRIFLISDDDRFNARYLYSAFSAVTAPSNNNNHGLHLPMGHAA